MMILFFVLISIVWIFFLLYLISDTFPSMPLLRLLRKFKIRTKVLYFKIKNRPKFKKGNQVEWLDAKGDTRSGVVEGTKMALKNTESDFGWMYTVKDFEKYEPHWSGKNIDGMRYYIPQSSLEIALSSRREDSLNQLLKDKNNI